MESIHTYHAKPKRPETVIQFGEGGFLRGFVDWMLQSLNDSGQYQGSAVIVQPIETGMCEKLSAQDCLYTHVMRGLENGQPVVKKQLIDVISRCINPYTQFADYLALARQPELSVIISNTTEAGIRYEPADRPELTPPASFPAKLTLLLYERFKAGLDGFLLLPCELIDKNGETLRNIVLRYAADWALGDEFAAWICEKNEFCNTLVDRIVTGHPKDEDMELPYTDEMVNTSELFHLWVIEGNQAWSDRFPADKLGLNVIWTDNLERYRTRKVRILNGAHTSLVPYAMLRGFTTVKECVDNPDLRAYLKRCIFEEIIPTLDLPEAELTAYANDVLERFSNPFIKHYLSSIALNSVSKFRVRVLPSILEYQKRFGKLPQTLIEAFSNLIAFYRTDMANDDKDVMAFMKTTSTAEILANAQLWGQDLSFLYDEVKQYENPSV